MGQKMIVDFTTPHFGHDMYLTDVITVAVQTPRCLDEGDILWSYDPSVFKICICLLYENAWCTIAHQGRPDAHFNGLVIASETSAVFERIPCQHAILNWFEL